MFTVVKKKTTFKRNYITVLSGFSTAFCRISQSMNNNNYTMMVDKKHDSSPPFCLVLYTR